MQYKHVRHGEAAQKIHSPNEAPTAHRRFPYVHSGPPPQPVSLLFFDGCAPLVPLMREEGAPDALLIQAHN